MTIDEGTYLSIGGVDQWVALRGSDDANPLLLILSGPGVALSAMAPFFAPWERDFTLAHWDQPGAGATFARNAAVGAGPLSFERLARDGVGVAEWALRRAGSRPLVLLGLSAGTIVGLRMAQARSDLFAAYVGTGQVVHWGRQQRLAYDAVLRAARDAGRTADVAALEQIGPPPYANVASDVVLGTYAGRMTPAEQAAFASLDPTTAAAMRTPPPEARYLPRGVTLP
ncbi:MAG: alpha/beta hydrolase, partial [Vicinamibacterales bacterium]